MTALNKTRRAGVAVALTAGAALALTACGAGQISQTASQVPAINGANADSGTCAARPTTGPCISVRNAHIIYPANSSYSLQPGGSAQLAFSLVNNSNNDADALTSISTDYASDVTNDSAALPANGTIASPPKDDTVENETAVLTNLKEGVAPGLTIPVTFNFQRAGAVTVNVPVDAGQDLQRQGTTAEGEH